MLIGFVGIRHSDGNLMLDHSIDHYLHSVDYLSLGRKFGGLTLLRSAFFGCTALGKILTFDNIRKIHIIVVSGGLILYV